MGFTQELKFRLQKLEFRRKYRVYSNEWEVRLEGMWATETAILT